MTSPQSSMAMDVSLTRRSLGRALKLSDDWGKPEASGQMSERCF